MRIEVIWADITQLEVDAIINPASPSLVGNTGAEGAILQAAGPELLEMCQRMGGCQPGDAKITPGFNLPAKYVIHAVGPRWMGGDGNERQLLAKCFQRIMELAREYRMDMIAVPVLSADFGYPLRDACQLGVTTIAKSLTAGSIPRKVYMTAFNERQNRELAMAVAQAPVH
ncbi:MAG TPA: macro domain-containing protein [Kofleriaceae bacterium]